MYVLANLFQLFLLPAALVGELLALGLLLVGWRKTRTAGMYALSGGAILYVLLALDPVSQALVAPLEAEAGRHQPGDLARAVLVVVLAGGVAEAAGPPHQPELYGTSWVRLARGLEVFDQLEGRVPLLYTGALRNPFDAAATSSEGTLARRAAERWGLSHERFWVEDESRDTYESAVATRRLVDAKGGFGSRPSIALVSSAWHLRRAAAVFRHAGFDVIPVGSDSRQSRLQPSWSMLIPRTSAFATSNVAIREWIGIVAYRLRDRL